MIKDVTSITSGFVLSKATTAEVRSYIDFEIARVEDRIKVAIQDKLELAALRVVRDVKKQIEDIIDSKLESIITIEEYDKIEESINKILKEIKQQVSELSILNGQLRAI